jgi:hypothetical protein
LRIHSDRKWPERIVFDTSVPTIVPPAQTAATDVNPAPTAASEFTAKARVRESFAQFRPADDLSKPDAKPQPKRKIAKRRAPPTAPQVALIAQQPQRFGFFGNNFFANNAW